MVVVKDPVCGMVFADEDAAGKIVYRNETYYFCAPSCKKLFESDPEKYLAAFYDIRNSNNTEKTDIAGDGGNEKDNRLREHD